MKTEESETNEKILWSKFLLLIRLLVSCEHTRTFLKSFINFTIGIYFTYVIKKVKKYVIL